jgi:hypothetical protein
MSRLGIEVPLGDEPGTGTCGVTPKATGSAGNRNGANARKAAKFGTGAVKFLRAQGPR